MNLIEVKEKFSTLRPSAKSVLLITPGDFEYTTTDNVFKYLTKKYRRGIMISTLYSPKVILKRIGPEVSFRNVTILDRTSDNETLSMLSAKLDLAYDSKSSCNFFLADSFQNVFSNSSTKDVKRFITYLLSKFEERGDALVCICLPEDELGKLVSRISDMFDQHLSLFQ